MAQTNDKRPGVWWSGQRQGLANRRALTHEIEQSPALASWQHHQYLEFFREFNHGRFPSSKMSQIM